MPRIPLFAIVLAILPVAASAQFPTMVADTVFVSSDRNTITARGNVEILSGERRLRAEGLVFDRESNQLKVIGPLTVVDEDGSLIVGESAELTADLREGIISGVRILLDENTQVAAAEMHRIDSRYRQLFKTVASSCNVCEERPVPLWSISARRVIHDRARRQLYFHNARFEIAGIPILYIHRLRMPDPTLDRATGFLIPKFKTSTNLASGVKIPYFITLGDHADLMLTPYMSSRTNTLEGNLRQEFTFGSLQLEGAVTDDDLRPRDVRSYLFANGRFFLPEDFRLNLDLELVSDHAYLWTYDYSDADRLSSSIEVTRSRRGEHVSTSINMLENVLGTTDRIGFDDKVYQGVANYQRRLWPSSIGGEVRLAFDAEISKGPISNAAKEKVRSYRSGVRADWLHSWTLVSGLITSARAQLAADSQIYRADNRSKDSNSRLIPSTALELRWPHVGISESRGTYILEPVMQIAWTDVKPRRHEGDRYPEFDEGNLIALGRFPEFDAYERDWRAAIGLGWTHLALGGSEYSITAGRLFRKKGDDRFVPDSGLSGKGSDWLFSAQAKHNRLTVATRSLLDNGGGFTRFGVEFAWQDDLTTASGHYIWASGAKRDTSEIVLETSRVVGRHWIASVNGRYDGSADRTTKAGLGLKYRNECVTVDISVSRRFSTSDISNVPTSTEFNVGVILGGLGRHDSGPERSCRTRR